TIIVYDVPRYSHVKIVVYDVLGREIKTIVDKMEQPGSHSIAFDGSRLSSGIYFYRMMSENFLGTKKMLLLR
ncbi:MAG: T9SS type A sorting domain-containing protein, partial [Bacteroidota bacterium]|nr:T9SS type A sorting domain-containing protein [Bacteroidota bacterium]